VSGGVNVRFNVQDLTFLFYVLKPYVLGPHVNILTHSIERNFLKVCLTGKLYRRIKHALDNSKTFPCCLTFFDLM